MKAKWYFKRDVSQSFHLFDCLSIAAQQKLTYVVHPTVVEGKIKNSMYSSKTFLKYFKLFRRHSLLSQKQFICLFLQKRNYRKETCQIFSRFIFEFLHF
jgi:hypothetical protein